MHLRRDSLPGEPGGELREAGRGVGEDLVLELACRVDQAHVELEFSDVDAECGSDHGMDSSLKIISCGAGQTCLYKLCFYGSGFRYCATSGAARMDAGSFSNPLTQGRSEFEHSFSGTLCRQSLRLRRTSVNIQIRALGCSH